MIDEKHKEEMKTKLVELNALLADTLIGVLKSGEVRGNMMSAIVHYLKLNGVIKKQELATPSEYLEALNSIVLPFPKVDD